MGEFKRPGGFGGNKNRGGFGGRDNGRPSFGNRPSFGGNRDDRRSEMFTATCDQCGRQCEVPFRPSGSKPVYCDNCFSAKKDGNNFSSREAPRHRSEQKDTFTFDTAPKPKLEDSRINELKKQIDAVNAKLDKLLHIAQGGNPAAYVTPVVKSEHIEQPKTHVILSKTKAAAEKVPSALAADTKKEVKKAPAKKKSTTKKK